MIAKTGPLLGAALLLFGLAVPAEARQHRSKAARCHFLASQGYPDCRVPRGFVIDHIWPLCAGGADDPSNMQLQTIAEAKAKDREERRLCRRR